MAKARAACSSRPWRQSPDKIVGLDAGYLGELDAKPYDSLPAKVRSLATQRGELANRTALVQRLADAAKGDEKKDWRRWRLAAGGDTLLKSSNAFIDSLWVGDTCERSPLFNTARYLRYAVRTRDMLVLDVDLQLEGMTIVKDNLFTGQRLRLARVAFLWYRLHEQNGALRPSDTVRRITAPVEVYARGTAAGGAF